MCMKLHVILIRNLGLRLVEMKELLKRGLCCGAEVAQMFKEPGKGKEGYLYRTEQKRL